MFRVLLAVAAAASCVSADAVPSAASVLPRSVTDLALAKTWGHAAALREHAERRQQQTAITCATLACVGAGRVCANFSAVCLNSDVPAQDLFCGSGANGVCTLMVQIARGAPGCNANNATCANKDDVCRNDVCVKDGNSATSVGGQCCETDDDCALTCVNGKCAATAAGGVCTDATQACDLTHFCNQTSIGAMGPVYTCIPRALNGQPCVPEWQECEVGFDCKANPTAPNTGTCARFDIDAARSPLGSICVEAGDCESFWCNKPTGATSGTCGAPVTTRPAAFTFPAANTTDFREPNNCGSGNFPTCTSSTTAVCVTQQTFAGFEAGLELTISYAFDQCSSLYINPEPRPECPDAFGDARSCDCDKNRPFWSCYHAILSARFNEFGSIVANPPYCSPSGFGFPPIEPCADKNICGEVNSAARIPTALGLSAAAALGVAAAN